MMNCEPGKSEQKKTHGMDPEWRGVVFLKHFVVHQQELYAYVLTLVPNLHDADDLFQEALTVMWRKFDQFEPGTNFVGWGVRIVQFLVLDYRRRKARDKQVQLSDEVLEVLAERIPAVQDRLAERMDILKRCMADLDDRAKRLIKMRFERNTSTQDMASTLELSIRQVQRALASINGVLLRCMRRRLVSERGSL
jgi:RNA polymerase sigma-70 factor (ECF subfamily)